ncbi:hypothetical protein DSJ_23800 (plasmid) [Pantoea stewartii subsp. stewartii DC283]|uniref:Recombinase family protein n=1 Tax=Pantoea stewartii subsp. stewartii DC283 TaxID=660596 RepID=A0ABN4ZBR3_PANSE|nr:hypothetical protein DSJ_23800 [Pantoea stewartii subsp. stewartii DC283]
MTWRNFVYIGYARVSTQDSFPCWSIAAEVVTGNTLTLELNRGRYTPVYYLNDFEERLESQRRIKAMMAFIRGMSEKDVNSNNAKLALELT